MDEPEVLGVDARHDTGQLRAARMLEHARSQITQEGDRLHLVRLGSHWDAITGHVFGRGVILSAGGGWEYYIARYEESNLRKRNQNQSVVVTNFHQQELHLTLKLKAIQCVVVTQIKPTPVRNRLHLCKHPDPQQAPIETIELTESWFFMTPDRTARFNAFADRYERSWVQLIRGELDFALWYYALGQETIDRPVMALNPLPMHTRSMKSVLREFGYLQESSWPELQKELDLANEVMARGTMAGQIRKPLHWKP